MNPLELFSIAFFIGVNNVNPPINSTNELATLELAEYKLSFLLGVIPIVSAGLIVVPTANADIVPHKLGLSDTPLNIFCVFVDLFIKLAMPLYILSIFTVTSFKYSRCRLFLHSQLF